MKWPWQHDEPQMEDPRAEHTARQDARVQEAQTIIDDARGHSDRELTRAHGILDDVRRAERMLAAYDAADRERRGGA